MNKKNLLKKISILQDLSPRDLTYITRIAQEEKFRKNQGIFSAAASGDSLYIVMEGRVKIYSSSASGKVKTLAYLEKGDFFGEMALLEEQSRSASAKALDDSTLLIIHRRDFQRQLKKNTTLALNFLRVLSNRLRRADREIESITFQNVFGRIAVIIMDLAQRYGEETPDGLRISIELTQQDLAQLAGTAREMVSRILNRLKRIGCVNFDEHDRRLTITNIEKIRELICQ